MPLRSLFKSARRSGAQAESSLPKCKFGIATDTKHPTVTLQGGRSTKHFYNNPEILTEGIALLTFNGEPNARPFGPQTGPGAPPTANATVVFRVAVLEKGVDEKALADLGFHCNEIYYLPEGYLVSHHAYMSSGLRPDGWEDTWAFLPPRE